MWKGDAHLSYVIHYPLFIQGNTINQIEHFNFYEGLFESRSVTSLDKFFNCFPVFNKAVFIGVNIWNILSIFSR